MKIHFENWKCPLFDGSASASSCLTRYQQILSVCSFRWKNVLNATCHHMILHNRHRIIIKASPVRHDALTQCEVVEAVKLATDTFIRGDGVRQDTVRNITCQDIWQAKRCLVQCPYCSDTVIWKSHKFVCEERKTSKDTSMDLPEKEFFRIHVRLHKTMSSR